MSYGMGIEQPEQLRDGLTIVQSFGRVVGDRPGKDNVLAPHAQDLDRLERLPSMSKSVDWTVYCSIDKCVRCRSDCLRLHVLGSSNGSQWRDTRS
jgi:hypothetical protein